MEQNRHERGLWTKEDLCLIGDMTGEEFDTIAAQIGKKVSKKEAGASPPRFIVEGLANELGREWVVRNGLHSADQPWCKIINGEEHLPLSIACVVAFAEGFARGYRACQSDHHGARVVREARKSDKPRRKGKVRK